MKVVEGSYAVAHAVMCCLPDVISAYPITPQTHIVEHLSQMVADGELDSEFLTVDSEFSALSVLVGASAAGARSYSSTTSQGLALMYEVLYNVSGMRLPIVMNVANRALSAPLNIWNDQQDSIGARDVGWLQIYAEDVQEAVDATLQAYRIAEDPAIRTPIMVCMDGFILTHVYEPVELLDKELSREFLPPFQPENILDPSDPKTFGAFADPTTYTEFRYLQFEAQQKALGTIEKVAKEFEETFGRYVGGLVDSYRAEDAEIIIVTMGSVIGTIKDAIDAMRAEGKKVGLVKVRSYRPFPVQALRKALKDASVIAVLEKDVAIGGEAGLLHGRPWWPRHHHQGHKEDRGEGRGCPQKNRIRV
jgi:pyruvate ferredoxin oxidoreductase alpha subunit